MSSKPLIEASLTTTATTSKEIRGADIVGEWGHAIKNPTQMTAAGCIQVVRTANTGNYEVRLEGGIRRDDGTTATKWGTVATVTQAENDNLITLTIAPGAVYRFRHVSGVAVTALLN